MTKKAFITRLSNGQIDVIQSLLELLTDLNLPYCVIGGLAVNAYVEPVVSLDLDLVVATEEIDQLLEAAQNIFTVKRFPHSVNLFHPQSDLRIQLQTDPRYQAFIRHAVAREVMGYDMQVAGLHDLLQGKIWAYADTERRRSKRQKDLADIFRLVEAYPELKTLLPDTIATFWDEDEQD